MPGDDWLIQFYLSFRRYGMAGGLGPVNPFFPSEALTRLMGSRFCDRASHAIGRLRIFFRQSRAICFLRDITKEGLLLGENSQQAGLCPHSGKKGSVDPQYFAHFECYGRLKRNVHQNALLACREVSTAAWSEVFDEEDLAGSPKSNSL